MPFIRSLALIEMIARSCKVEFGSRLRDAILHFRSVGATNIDAEMKQYATAMFNSVLGCSDRSKLYFETKLKPRLAKSFDYVLSHQAFVVVHRPALFLAMQYQVFMNI